LPCSAFLLGAISLERTGIKVPRLPVSCAPIYYSGFW
jgi:hypothetical protein